MDGCPRPRADPIYVHTFLRTHSRRRPCQPSPPLAARQSPPASPPDQSGVTFKVEINYVEVDASVFDRQGQFVSDLKREDFEVLEDGVRRTSPRSRR